jgi:transcriptional regulator with XRE-family HTH domain
VEAKCKKRRKKMATSKQGTIDWLMLGNRISDMRRSRNMTQLELAERLGTSDVYIGYLEQGKRHGTLETFINIVNILGYSMDDLLEMYLVRSAPDAFDTKLLVENCTQEERDLIFHMIHEVLLFTRSRQ